MAKINHNNFVDTINDIVGQAKQKGIIHLNFDADHWNGRDMVFGDTEMVNFGTCGYLGLETHPKLIQGAIDYTSRYGTQFSISRAYVSAEINDQLEVRLGEVFSGSKTIVFSSTTLAHIAMFPLVMDNTDAIILDQQAHVSMQTAAQLVGAKGTPIEMIRHNNMEMLERKIQSLGNRYRNIWYVIDGVYSMYGDLPPIDELNALAQKYPQLHFYVDDAHGMSWMGTNGSGSVFDSFKDNNKTLLVSTMAKGFGSTGGVVVFPNEEMYERVKIHGGPLAYSHPIAPSIIGASIASADIHLSDELYDLQSGLRDRINYCNELLTQTDIPILSNEKTPIYFIGTGQPNVGYNLNQRILNEGFYVNIGMFPAVPVKNTGLRFTMTNHVTMDDIKNFVDAIAYHYPLALEEEGRTNNQVRKAFKMSLLNENKITEEEQGEFKIITSETIQEIDRKEWDDCFMDKGNFTWEVLKMMEKVFCENELPENNWKFHYYIVKDQKGKVILATFFTSGLFKDDLISPANVSRIVEDQRMEEPYYLCSQTLTMGSLFTEGDHLYIDRNIDNWQESVKKLLEYSYTLQEEESCNSIVLRDFHVDDKELADIFHDQGFFKVDMPNSNVITFDTSKLDENFIDTLSKRSRRGIRYDVMKYYDEFHDEIKNNVSESDLNEFYQLYLNVADNNFGVNIFKYPKILFEEMRKSENWEFFVLKDLNENQIGFFSSYKTDKTYNPVLVGVEYSYSEKASVYKQIMYRVTDYARTQGYEQMYFGLTADTEKKKLGAQQIHKVAYVTVKDQFNMEVLDKLAN